MKKTILYISCALLAACGGDTQQPKSATTNTETPAATEQAPKENWEYFEKEDKMDGKTTKYARVNSKTNIKFDFPYGYSEFYMTVRSVANEKAVMVQCTKCQFIGGVGGENTYRLKFDEETPIKVTATYSSSGNPDIIFLGSETKIISKLKTAKQLIIEPEFYDYGRAQLEFDVDGFKWD